MTTESEKSAQLKRALQAIKDLRTRLETVENARREPIAIIGTACRFPGGVETPEAYWQMLENQVDGMTTVPEGRWNADALFDADPDMPGKVSTRWGGFLPDLDQFDAAFFGISPREAAHMDPQQRLMLEVAWEAFEDAGLPIETLAGSRTGIFVGLHSHSNDYYLMQSDLDDIDVYTGTGTSHSVVSGRIAYLYDLQGPNIALDTACSSSLSAVHLAVQSLRSGESNLALAGGVNVMLTPHFTVAASRMRMMAADGRCKAFDSRADGFVRGEGCGAVILKRLSDAQRDGDPILAVIRGSAMSQDGHSNGLTAPNGLSQQAVIRQALENSGVRPEQVSFVETHGTGTPLGDPIEVEALGAIYGQPRADGLACLLGSAKTNVGHLEGAAGVAGLIKTILCLQHGFIPANLHFQELNPHISLTGTRIQVASSACPWQTGSERRFAGLSAFGWSGTNVHIILEEAPQSTAPTQPIRTMQTADPIHLLPITARSKAALAALAQEFEKLLNNEGMDVAAVCNAAVNRRSQLPERLIMTGRSAADLSDNLEAFIRGETRTGLTAGSILPGRLPGIVFVCSGQGGQWLGMGRQLAEHEPVFLQELKRCELAFQPYVDWSLLEQIAADETTSRLNEINVVQPILFAYQVALAALWRSWGVEPEAVVGHSMGEISAAAIAGALSLEDAARVICTRSQLMRRMSGKGAMAVVGLPLEKADALLVNYPRRLSVAVSNGPDSTVISGEPAALEEVLADLRAQNIFCRSVNVDVAAHSPQMDGLRPELEEALRNIQPQNGTIPFYSTVTGSRVDGNHLDAAYWGKNLRQPVRFADTTTHLLEDGFGIFVELNPHPILLSAIEQTAKAWNSENSPILVESSRRGVDERLNLRSALGSLYVIGFKPRWEELLTSTSGQWVALPNYPWQREHQWLETNPSMRASSGNLQILSENHPLLRERIDLPGQSGLFWQIGLKRSEFPALFQHRLNGSGLLAASTSVELALAAAQSALPGQAATIHDLAFQRALPLSENDRQPSNLFVTLTPANSSGQSFDLYSRQGESWLSHIHASLRADAPAETTVTPLSVIQSRVGAAQSGKDFYHRLEKINVQIGTLLQAIDQIWQKPGEILAHLKHGVESQFLFDPALLDAGFQLLGALPAGITDDICMPVIAEQILVQKPDTQPAWVHAFLHQPASAEALIADLQWFDEAGVPVLRINGLHLKRLAGEEQVSDNPADWLYEPIWEKIDRPLEPSREQLSGSWLILADQSGVGKALADQLNGRGAACTLVFLKTDEHQTGQYLYVDPESAAEVGRITQQALAGGDLRGIIHLWSLDAPSSAEWTPAELEAAQLRTSGSSILLIQELSKVNLANPPQLWLVTRAAQAVLPADTVQSIQAPLWGLGRVMAVEQPEFFGGLIDLPEAEKPDASASALIGAILQPGEDTQLALREGQWFTPRLKKLPESNVASIPLFRPDAAYLITGGLGGVGQQIATWAARQGARRLIIMGRTPLPARNAWASEQMPRIRQMISAIRELEAAGVNVQYAAVDVAEEQQLAAFVNNYHQENWPPIRGVIHAAGVIDDRMMLKLDNASLQTVMRPKMVGSWLLHQILKDDPLDFFVMFSSLGSLLGQAGQGNYAAANAFLDALAHSRRSMGLPALTINWGAWSGLGFAATAGGKRVLEKLDLQGLPAFTSQQGMVALQLLMNQKTAQAVVIPVHWERLQASGLARERMWFRLLQEQAQSAPRPVETQQSFRDILVALPKEDRRAFLQSHIQKTLAQVLKMAPERIEAKTPLGSLGLESLLAVEFRNRLEASLDLKLSATLVWSYPTLYDITGFLLNKLAPEESPAPLASIPAAQSQQADTTDDEVVQKVKAMSDEDALQALRNRRKGK